MVFALHFNSGQAEEVYHNQWCSVTLLSYATFGELQLPRIKAPGEL